MQSAAVPLEEAVKGEESEKPLPLLEVVSCLAAVWQRTTAESATECGDAVSKSIAISLNPGAPLACSKTSNKFLLLIERGNDSDSPLCDLTQIKLG